MTKTRPTKRMSTREYIQAAGQRCPYCRSWDVRHAGKLEEGEDGLVRRKVRCYECGATWDEVYALKTWED